MEAFLSYVYQQLSAIHPRVYLERAPTSVRFPYVTYQAPSSGMAEHREDITLVVDIWDQTTDPLAIEQIASQIEQALDRHRYLAQDQRMQLSFFKTSRLQLLEPDDLSIRRRQLRFTVKMYLI